MKIFEHIPNERPVTPLLDSVNTTANLRQLEEARLTELADELREFLLYTVGQTGGHFGAGLGVVELTIALHYIFQTPDDRLVWDVGHQTYPHKILTGRRDRMLSMRQPNGLAGFTKRAESTYDTFGVGHSSTSISAALGMALASRINGEQRKHVAIIGDGAMTAGMAFEALNHAAHTEENLLVILNDNNMSITHNVGGLSSYFARMWASKPYTFIREHSKRVLSTVPKVWQAAHRAEEYVKGMIAPGTLFEELGFNYIGLIDGHNLKSLAETLDNMKDLEGPQLLHVGTQKGKGYAPSEQDTYGTHFLNKIESKPKPKPTGQKPKYQEVFGQWLCDMAAKDERLVGITPAMMEGSGMMEFAQQFPQRFHDVAIAEQHAVTLGAGFACENLKPVIAIYSTFLQRAYDQLIHDVAIQNLDVLFAIDRAGLVGEDGPTHAGSFDLSYLRCIPNMVIAAPSDENECRQLLYSCYQHSGPAAVRYPRGTGPGNIISQTMNQLPIGKGVIRRKGLDIAILAFGSPLEAALEAAEQLNASVADMRFIKPLDEQLIKSLANNHELLVTVEDNAIMGGAGSAVLEFLQQQQILKPVLSLGIPDSFIDQNTREGMLKSCGVDKNGILIAIKQRQKQKQHECVA